MYKFQKIKYSHKKDPCPLPFINEMLNTIAGYETYYSLDEYLKYHQIFIALKDKYKTAFVTNSGAFIRKVMSFGMKNGPPTYHEIVTKTFIKYLENFKNIFVDDFIVYSDMESHLYKLKLCFQKCKKCDISLNLDKCAFMVFSGMILGFIVFKEGELPNPKKIQAIVNMPPPKNPQHIQLFNGMA
jgi:hypothetical protein